MRIWGLHVSQTVILNFLYELRNSPMTPPDARTSLCGIAKALGMNRNTVSKDLDALEKKDFVWQYLIVRTKYCRIALRGIREIEKVKTCTFQSEISTSGIGLKNERKTVC